MFGIGLPEMILILALALIVVGPDKLPDLARSMAKGIMELKKTAEALKKNLAEDGTLDSIKSDLNNAGQHNLLESPDQPWRALAPGEGVNPAPDKTEETIIEAELSEMDETKAALPDEQATEVISETPAPLDSEKEPNTHQA